MTAPVEEVTAPIEEAPAPIEEAPAPVEEAPAPVEEASAPVEEAPAPVEEVPASVEEVTAPVEEVTAHVEEAPAPIEEAPAPVEEAPAPVEEAPALVEEALAPVEEAPTLVEEAPAPVEEAPAPVEEAPAPVEEAPAPVEEAPAPVEEAPALVEEAPAPAEEPTEEDFLLVSAVNGGGSRVYAEPNENSAVIGTLNPGDMVMACALGNGWAKVTAGGLNGYVRTNDIIRYITEETPEEEKAPIIRSVAVYSTLDGLKEIAEGAEIVLTARLTGFEDTSYRVQWQYSADGGASAIDAPGGSSLRYVYRINAQTIRYLWRIVVTVEDN